MNEVQILTYISVIEKVCSCQEGQEWIVIKTYEKYFDAGMHKIMNRYVEALEKQKDKELADWLRLLAESIVGQGLEQMLLQNYYLRLINEIIWLCKSQANEPKIDTILRENIVGLDEGFLNALPVAFKGFIEANQGKESGIASAFTGFGHLIWQFPQGNRAQNVEIAIAAYQLALQVHTREFFPREWATIQNNLGISYRNRIKGSRSDNLELAIDAYEKALEVRDKHSSLEDWIITKINLGIAYSNHILGDPEANLEIAIDHLNQSLCLCNDGKFKDEKSRIQISLASVYTKFGGKKREHDLEVAISLVEQVLHNRDRNESIEKWVNAKRLLGIIYKERVKGKPTDNLKYAIEIYGEVLHALTPTAFPEQWACTQFDLAQAWSLYSECIQHRSSQRLKQAINAYRNALTIYTPNNFPNQCRMASANLANLQTIRNDWNNAAAAYDQALSATENLYQPCILLNSKTAELLETDDLPRRAAYAYTKIDALEKAVETLEKHRARGLSESLERDRANLTQLQQSNPELYAQYQDITNQLRNIEAQQRERMISVDRSTLTPNTLRNEVNNLHTALQETIDQICQVPGYENFLTLPKFAEVRQAAQCDRPLVYLVSTSAGSLALFVTPDNIDVIWLNRFNSIELADLLNKAWFAAYNQFQSEQQGWYDAIDHVTHQLWKPLMEPLIRHLQTQDIDQAILIPTGYLSLLPLHAAWTEDSTTPTGRHYALDDIHFTYAPNARSLIAAQTIATHTQADSILAIDNPTQDLPNSEREVQSAIAHFSQHQVLRHREAAIASVREALQHCNILHLSCHGTANLQEPLTSGLLMSDGLLTLKDILALNLAESATGGIRLAILSACETGLTGIENADEAIGLPTGLLQAGVAGVIGSLWSVSELSTMILLTRFYDLWRKDGLEPAIALNQAQRWMHSTTDGEKAQYCGLITSNPSDRTYAHPFHWAAFSYLGV